MSGSQSTPNQLPRSSLSNEKSFANNEKRNIILEQHPFLKNKQLSDNIKSFIKVWKKNKRLPASKFRQKRTDVIPIGQIPGTNSILVLKPKKKEIEQPSIVPERSELDQFNIPFQILPILLPVPINRTPSNSVNATVSTTTPNLILIKGNDGKNPILSVNGSNDNFKLDNSGIKNYELGLITFAESRIIRDESNTSSTNVETQCNEDSTTTVQSFSIVKVNLIKSLNELDQTFKAMEANRKTTIISETTESTTQNQNNGTITLKNTYENGTTSNNETMSKQILDNGDGLKTQNEKSSKTDLPCQVNGTWSSQAAGMCFNISVGNGSNLTIYSMANIPPKKGFFDNNTWTLTGYMPFSSKGLLVVTAIQKQDQQVATFIGECKVCDDSELIMGQWLIGRPSRDCRDSKASQEILGDIWRREALHALRAEKLRKLKRS